MTKNDTLPEKEVERKEQDTLKRLLSTPPQPRKSQPTAARKKRGRPPGEKKGD